MIFVHLLLTTILRSQATFAINNFTGIDENGGSVVPSGRIYGGRLAERGKFPYQAYLHITTADGPFACGGCLISNQWILTAAHCTDGATSITVKMGIIDSKATAGQKRVTKEYIQHPLYDVRNVASDISLVKLPEPFILTNNVNTIKLPKKSQASIDTFSGQAGVVSGWGSLQNGQTTSTKSMHYAQVKVMPHARCRAYYRSYNVNEREICTDNAATKSGTCQGDSGGPLVVFVGRTPMLIGLTSWGVAECQTGAPSVYTNVAAYLKFIHRNTGIPVEE